VSLTFHRVAARFSNCHENYCVVQWQQETKTGEFVNSKILIVTDTESDLSGVIAASCENTGILTVQIDYIEIVVKI